MDSGLWLSVRRWWAQRPPIVGQALRSRPVQFVVGPGLLLAATFFSTGWALALALPGFVLVQGSALAANARAKRADAQLELQVMLQQIVLALESHHPDGSATFRASIMMFSGDALQIQYQSGTYSDEELALRWRKGEGASGHAWSTRQIQEAPTEDDPLPTAADGQRKSRPWNMTPEQIAATCHVQWVIAVPIVSRADNRVVAVFTVDDTVPPSDRYREAVPEAVQAIASLVAARLERLGLG